MQLEINHTDFSFSDNKKKTKNVAIIVIVAVMIFSVGCSYLVWNYRKSFKSKVFESLESVRYSEDSAFIDV